jgi:hypothetical protein
MLKTMRSKGVAAKMHKYFHGSFSIVLAGLLVCSSGALAKDKKVKAAPAAPKDEIEVVGHIPLAGGPIARFSSTQHYSSYYLYAEHDGTANVTLIDVTKPSQPSVLADVPYAPDGRSQSLLVVAGTAALVNSEPGVNAASSAAPQTLRIMDFSDPQHPKVAREFTGVTAIGRNDPRGFIFVANSDGIWILKQHLAEDPEVEKAYENYIQYYR